ncbi:MAG: transglutaminase domain-containing protein [Clostridia bacterium]|nr:transglutaminase domain-containing protein [Clostridia bacterium]
MKKRILVLILILALLLAGCSWMDGSYVYVEPYVGQGPQAHAGSISASNYVELLRVLEQLVNAGTQSCTIDIGDFDREEPDSFIQAACRNISNSSAMGAYAVEDITYELGTNNGREAVAVTITYRRSQAEILRIQHLEDMEALAGAIRSALSSHTGRVVYLVEDYRETDLQAVIQDYAQERPQDLMEVPQLSEGIYGTGGDRVVELNFTYQNSRDALRQMQTQVRTVFEAASLYVSGDASDHQKLSQLYGFLTERFEYKMDTSITPSYSLICHGVGDSRAFAEVYAAMCRQAGLECLIVTGTRDGAPWTWNMVLDGERYYHVDLLRQSGSFREFSDMEMGGYVWDYSAYPVCDAYYQEPVVTVPTEATEPPQEETEPETTQENETE